ncbi:hypothetical protein ES703_25815 [subsurface metagenome]
MKQKTWRPGQGKSTVVLADYGDVNHNGRRYRLVKVRTGGGLVYFAFRLYNADGHFIKAFMFEPEIRGDLIALLERSIKDNEL